MASRHLARATDKTLFAVFISTGVGSKPQAR